MFEPFDRTFHKAKQPPSKTIGNTAVNAESNLSSTPQAATEVEFLDADHTVPLAKDWLTSVHHVLDGFASLETGWNTYAAPPPNSSSIALAREFSNVLHESSFRPDRVAPSAIGGVGVTFRRRTKRAYIEFRNDGLVYLVLAAMPLDPTIRQIRAERQDFVEAVSQIRDFLDA